MLSVAPNKAEGLYIRLGVIVVIFKELSECDGVDADKRMTDYSSAIVVHFVRLVCNLITGLTSLAAFAKPVELIYLQAAKRSAQVQ